MQETHSAQAGNSETIDLAAGHPILVPANASATRLVKVAMIVGDNHTLHCGVKDGAHLLAEALGRVGFRVDVMAPDAWNRLSVWKFIKQIKRGRYDILHVQYPSIGYRTTLVPHLLGLLRVSRGTVATIHEFSALPKAQQLTTHIFRWSAGRLMFASEFERSRYNQHLGSLGAVQAAFPVVSQVPAVSASTGRDTTVVYFGQIRTKKGLEAYLDLARRSIKLDRPYQFHIIGSVSKAHLEYARALQAAAPPEVRWSFDLPFDEVGKQLGKSFAAYLPFPDGASERRGSLAAALLNGLPTLSTVGSATTPAIRALFIPVENAEEALLALDRLAQQPNECERLSQAAREYARDRTWEDVAQRHAVAYRAVLSR